MSEKIDVITFASSLNLNIVFDARKSQAFIEDNIRSTKNNFFRGIGIGDTDEYISNLFYKKFGYWPSPSAIKSINTNLTFKAKTKSSGEQIHCRVVKKKYIYVNLGDGRIMKISNKKVNLEENVQVKFEVNSSLSKMAFPDLENHDLNLLKKYLNATASEFKLILVFIFNCFFTDTHYLMLVLSGPAGSAKSFMTKVLKMIIDPSETVLINQITKTEDLLITAMHSHLIAMNNVSRCSDAIQDALCTTLTGGAGVSRTKYTNKGQSVIHTHNPVILNGIGHIISRDDLYERAIVINLKKLSETSTQMVGEKQLNNDFNKDLPRIIAGVFDALSKILSVYENFKVPAQLNRMADFHILGLVTEKALQWKEGSFTKAYDSNLSKAQIDVLEDSEIAEALIKMGKSNSEFEGSCTDLKVRLDRYGNFNNITPRKLRADIDRISDSLFKLHGIKIIHLKRKSSSSHLKIIFS